MEIGDEPAIDEEMLESMTDEEIEAYLNSLYGDEFTKDGETAEDAEEPVENGGEEPAEAAE